MRWNRKRRYEIAPDQALPPVFAGGVLQAADELHQRATAQRLYQAED
jgi:hypothetical protein